jgi:hypothetical protein
MKEGPIDTKHSYHTRALLFPSRALINRYAALLRLSLYNARSGHPDLRHAID